MNDFNVDPAGKRTFTAPRLEVYGRARDITRAIGGTGAKDGSNGTNQKTRP
jgi:hypothetical protein